MSYDYMLATYRDPKRNYYRESLLSSSNGETEKGPMENIDEKARKVGLDWITGSELEGRIAAALREMRDECAKVARKYANASGTFHARECADEICKIGE